MNEDQRSLISRKQDATPMDRDIAVLDEQLLEPARTGLRRVAGGLGKAGSGALIVSGLASGVFGAILMALTTLGVVDAIGAFFLAVGITGSSFGALGLWAVKRAGDRAERRAIERRVLKIARIDGEVRDQAVAERLRVPVEVVRDAASALFRAGVLDVDLDEESGGDVYRPVPTRRDVDGEFALSPEEAEAMRRFDARLQAAQAEAMEVQTEAATSRPRG